MTDTPAINSEPKGKRKRKSGWDVLTSKNDSSSILPILQQIETSSTTKLNPSNQLIVNPMSRRIYIGSIYYGLSQDDIVKVFSAFGDVKTIEMSTDPATGLSKGYCFLEFADSASAEASLMMNGFELAGRKLKVGRPTQAQSFTNPTPIVKPTLDNPAVESALEKIKKQLSCPQMPALATSLNNSNQVTYTGQGSVLNPPHNVLNPQQSLINPISSTPLNLPGCRIYVGSIDYSLSEADIILIFSAFGTVSHFHMTKDPISGHSKGYCFIEFANPESANAAMTMNGVELAGRKIKVGRPTNNVSSTQNTVQVNNINITNPISSITQIQQSVKETNQSKSTLKNQKNESNSLNEVIELISFTANKHFVYACNLPSSIEVQQVRTLFSPYGLIECIALLPNQNKFLDTNNDSISAVIQYNNAQSTTEAALKMTGLNLIGNIIKVQIVFPLEKASELLSQATLIDLNEKCTMINGNVISEIVERAKEKKILILENMVKIEDLNDSQIRDEIWEEVEKYGILIDLKFNHMIELGRVDVELILKSNEDAKKVEKAMNGRWFDKRKIVARFK